MESLFFTTVILLAFGFFATLVVLAAIVYRQIDVAALALKILGKLPENKPPPKLKEKKKV